MLALVLIAVVKGVKKWEEQLFLVDQSIYNSPKWWWNFMHLWKKKMFLGCFSKSIGYAKNGQWNMSEEKCRCSVRIPQMIDCIEWTAKAFCCSRYAKHFVAWSNTIEPGTLYYHLIAWLHQKIHQFVVFVIVQIHRLFQFQRSIDFIKIFRLHQKLHFREYFS